MIPLLFTALVPCVLIAGMGDSTMQPIGCALCLTLAVAIYRRRND